MTLSWGARQLIAFVLLAVVLVCVTGLLELMSAVRLVTRQATIEAELVTGSVRRELAWLITRYPERDLEALARSAGMHRALHDAMVLAPSVVSVGVLAPNGVYVAHPDTTRIGSVPVSRPYLPVVSSTRDAVNLLLELRGGALDYQSETALLRNEQPLGTVHVVVAGAFLWNAIEEAISRGLVTAGIMVALALLAGVVLSRLLTGRVRTLERAVRALSEGRLDVRVPQHRKDEFSGLAEALNALGDRFRETARPPAGRAPVDLSPVLTRLGHMASGVAHELRNHLQRAELELELAQREEREARSAAIGRARQAIRSVEDVVRGYLRISSIGALDLRPTDVNRLLAEVRDELAAQSLMAGVTVVVEETPLEEEPAVDRVVVKQALHNAVRNAIQSLEGREDGRVVLGASRHGASVNLCVEDNGPGMKDDVRRRAFEPYFTTRSDGSGVGLALIAQTAELHGGRARLESEEGRGTRLILELPC